MFYPTIYFTDSRLRGKNPPKLLLIKAIQELEKIKNNSRVHRKVKQTNKTLSSVSTRLGFIETETKDTNSFVLEAAS